jgi:hypothetical protein
MSQAAAKKIGLLYVVITNTFLFIIPKQTFGNVGFLIVHLVVCLVLIYFSFRRQSPEA